MDQLIIQNKLDKLLNKAIKHNEVPVSALLIKNNKIISKSYNRVNKKNNILNHAEINCIIKAQKKLKNWRLNDCELYVTLEPCSMCKEIIKKSRIKKVYYYIKQNNYINESEVEYDYIESNTVFSDKLINFFKERR